MKAITQNSIGNAETMYIGEVDIPVLRENEVMVQVKAFGVNRADILQRKGNILLLQEPAL